MRGVCAGSAGLLLGLLAAAAPAEEFRWRPAVGAAVQPGPASASTPSPAPAACLGRPLALEATSTPRPDAAPVACLGRPVPADTRSATPPGAPWSDPGLFPVAFSPALGAAPRMTTRAKGPDAPQPMPQSEPLKGPQLLEAPQEEQYNAGVVTQPPSGPEVIVPGPVPVPGPTAVLADEPVTEGDLVESDDDTCGPRFWVRGEYLLWTTRNGQTPALVTTSRPLSGGRLNEPDTVVLFGGSIDYGDFSGARLTAGLWLDACRCYGLEGSAFFLQKRTVSFSAASTGNPLLARPFINASTGQEDTNLAFDVDTPARAMRVSATSQLWGAELNGVLNLARGPVCELSLLGGFRYLRLREDLKIGQESTLLEISARATDLTEDLFATRNDFYGGQIGLRSAWAWCNWRLDLTGKVAVGETHEVANINFVRVLNPTFPGFIPSGLLAAPTNAGHYTRDRLAFVPQVGINLGYQFTEHWRAFVGYDFLYWSKVARPGDEIDRVVNPNQVAGLGLNGGPARPAFNFNDSAFWAQGASAGIEFRY